MIIPKQFTVGSKTYEVVEVSKLPGHIAGKTRYVARQVLLANTPGVPALPAYTPTEKAVAFWHEALHTMLEDMGLPLKHHYENVIDEMAERLAQICDTAKL